MIFPVALISAFILFPAAFGSGESCYLSEEQEDECASVCYPIVKPLLRYFEKIQEKDADLLKCRTDFSELQKRFSDLQSEDLKQYVQQVSKWQQDYSDLLKSNLEVLSQLKDTEVKYSQLQSKHLEVDNLNTLINKKNKEIELLKDQNRNLKKTNELATLTNQFREDIDKLEKIVKIGGINENNPTKSEVEAGKVPTTPLPNIRNQTTSKTETIDFPDPCPRDQEEFKVLREIQLPGSDPFKVVCESDSDIGSGWLTVYRKLPSSTIFNRTYEDYERGFGDVGIWGNEFFIGLNRLHRLTSGKPHEVLLYAFGGSRRCDHFVVGGRSEGYEVRSIDGCTGGTSMMPKQGSKFSTFDRDLDGVPGRNLAKESGYGWWFDPDMSHDPYGIYMYIRRTD